MVSEAASLRFRAQADRAAPGCKALNQVITIRDPNADVYLYCDVSRAAKSLFLALTRLDSIVQDQK